MVTPVGSERRDGTVVSLGVFDGVHRGHKALIEQARGVADALGLPLVVVTFHPHPLAVVRPGAEPPTLTGIDERVALLLEAGVDEVDVLAFDIEFSRQSPEEFVHAVLVERLCARAVVVGENFRFGAGAAGDVHILRELGRTYGFDAHVAQIRADDEPWSSTRIREHLTQGEVTEANRLLDREYAVPGIVVHGDHRGRELGYPTANIHCEGTPVIPADGVYAGRLRVGGEVMPAAISIGTNPQFDGQERRIEAYAIDRVGLDLYGLAASVSFTARLRPQGVFGSLEAFLEQMSLDVEQARHLLAAEPGVH